MNGVLAVPRETLAAATPSVAHLPQHCLPGAKNPRPPVRKYDDGTSNVSPFSASDIDAGMADTGQTWDDGGSGGGLMSTIGKVAGGMLKGTDGSGGGSGSSSSPSQQLARPSPASSQQQMPGAHMPSMGMVLPQIGYAKGIPRVPGALAKTDTVPAMLSPGEAVLNRNAAEMLGRDKIAAFNAAGKRNQVQGFAAGDVLRSSGITTRIRPKVREDARYYPGVEGSRILSWRQKALGTPGPNVFQAPGEYNPQGFAQGSSFVVPPLFGALDAGLRRGTANVSASDAVVAVRPARYDERHGRTIDLEDGWRGRQPRGSPWYGAARIGASAGSAKF